MSILAQTFIDDFQMRTNAAKACPGPSNSSSCRTPVRPEGASTLTSMNSLALTFKALERYNRRRKLQRTWLPAPSTYTALYMSNCARFYRNSQYYTKALEFNLQALDAFQLMFGSEHRYTLKSMNSLASTYSCLEEYEKAKELFLHVLNVRKRLLGPEHLDTLASMHNLAVTHYWLKRPAKAKDLLDKVIKTLKEKYGDEGDYKRESDQTLVHLRYEKQTRRTGEEINGLRIYDEFEA
jgi:tetratricopeptide (TPR) repeat protein